MKNLSMKIKMALAVSLLFVPVIFLLGWMANSYQEQSLKKAISNQQFLLVSSLAASIDDKLRLAHNALIASARQMPPDALNDAERAQHFLDARISLLSVFDNGLFLLSREGKLIAESPFLPRRRGLDLASFEFFRQTLATGKPFISRPYLSLHTPGHPAIVFSAPIFDRQGRLTAILGGSFDLWGSNFLEDIAHTRYGDASSFYLTDRDRTVIVHSDRRRIMTRELPQGANSIYEKALTGFDGSDEAVNSQGIRVISSVRHLQTTGWILVASYPAAEAYAPLKAAKRYLLLVVAGLSIAILPITWLLMRWLTAPLVAFTRHVESFPQDSGRFKPFFIESGDEIGIMARAYNSMVKSLEEQQTANQASMAQQKRAEEALQEEKEKFSLAFQAMPSVIAISTLEEGRYLEVNEAFEKAMGYGRGEVIGRSAAELDTWEKPEERDRVLQMLTRGEKVRNLELRFRQKSGAIIYSLFSAEVIVIGGQRCLLSLTTDIGARKRAEEKLRRSEERYRRLYNETPVMLHSIDQEGRLVSVSNCWLDTMGYERDEVLGRRTTDFLTEGCRRYAEDIVIPEFLRTGVCKEVPYQFVKKNGEIIHVLLSAIAERNEEGKVVRSLAVVIDVTERKHDLEEIERLHTDLAARAFALENANRELESFSYSVSHDLRKPLTVINGYSQLIRELCGSGLNDVCQGYLREIFDETLQMNELIDAILKLSVVTRNEVSRDVVDLSAIASEVAAELNLTAPERRVAFVIEGGVTVNGDAKLLRVVLENLLGNAWKYTMKRQEARIEFGVADVSGKPACFVRDNGPGFKMDDAEKIFVPFQRLAGADRFKGHGIGLATVERIIRRHGGRIWAEGAPGQGATFWFTV
ncbi:PAS domain S-box protein [Geotalea sp. SG265]|uniref:PAS domain S-box protein n=1 Tax=Geotalea sp. SG265 TaxID=2922867 RepID=UPI001FB002F5|nr:PAS domain S-box protein [Geotalea sp. SG265]